MHRIAPQGPFGRVAAAVANLATKDEPLNKRLLRAGALLSPLRESDFPEYAHSQWREIVELYNGELVEDFSRINYESARAVFVDLSTKELSALAQRLLDLHETLALPPSLGRFPRAGEATTGARVGEQHCRPTVSLRAMLQLLGLPPSSNSNEEPPSDWKEVVVALAAAAAELEEAGEIRKALDAHFAASYIGYTLEEQERQQAESAPNYGQENTLRIRKLVARARLSADEVHRRFISLASGVADVAGELLVDPESAWRGFRWIVYPDGYPGRAS